jgi:pimeloyl-ACP methyl ester carboxylesterase
MTGDRLMTTYHTTTVDGARMFYRQAGKPGAPAVLLLHGFPTSSHMFRDLIPALADRYWAVAPDFPGIGFSDTPDRKTFACTFEHLAAVIDRFTEVIGLKRFAIYVFDYGAPVRFRLALKHPERITAASTPQNCRGVVPTKSPTGMSRGLEVEIV